MRNDGFGTASGTFTVPIEPQSHRWELATNVFGVPLLAVGNARHPTLDMHQLGRLDAVAPSVETNVTFDVTGMVPWDAGDTTEVVVGNNGTVVFSPDQQFATPPAIGDTAFTGKSIDWSSQPGATLVDASRGDVAMMEQLIAHTSGAETFSTVERAGTAGGFSQTDGVASTLSIAMQPVPQRSHVLRWRGASFDALASSLGAGASSVFATMFIDAEPDADRFGFYGFAAPDLLLYTPSSLSVSADLAVHYGNPYRSTGRAWDEFATVLYFYQVPVQLGDAAPLLETLVYQANTAVDEDIVIAPRISAVRDVQIAPPFVRWQPPTIGHATQYFLTLERLGVADGVTTSETIVQFYTKDRELEIPGTYLESGATYVMKIQAINFGTVDRTTDLFGDGLPFAGVTMITESFTP
ncbi:MAG TPA: hypothetical protein VGO00_01575 [Kofleriaceae bacterium]|nr:hypothetical protein [Kofleriaceae bacterium]